MVARANPYILNPSSAVAFAIVALSALIVEAGVVALLLAFVGVAPLRMFAGFLFMNVAVFAFCFYPLMEQRQIPLVGLEVLVVAIDAAAIKLLSRFAAFQADSYRGLSWLFAGLTALVGNGVSFFIGVIASGSPWEAHSITE